MEQKIKEPYVESIRGDALGCRMMSVVSAYWIAEKLNYNFYFNWIDYKEEISGESLSTTQVKVRDIFSDSFIEKHTIVKECYLGFNFPIPISINELESYKAITFSQPCFPYEVLKGINKDECLCELSYIYKNKILWSDRYKQILNDVDVFIPNKNWVAIHVRGKDIVCSIRNQAPEVWMYLYFPYEVVIEIAIEEISNGNFVILFGQDSETNLEIRDIVRKITNKSEIEISDNLIRKSYNSQEKAFVDTNLMSKAIRVYWTGNSGFSKLSQLISGKEILVSIYQKYNKKELCDIILKYINQLEINRLYTAFSLYMLYSYSRDIGVSLQECVKYIQEALKINPINIGYKIALNDYLLNINKFEVVEKYLFDLISASKYQEFESFLYGAHIAPFQYGYHSKFYTAMINAAESSRLPYLSYVSAKILIQIYKDNKRAYEILRLAMEQTREILQLRIEIIEGESSCNSNTLGLDMEIRNLKISNENINFSLKYGTAKSRIQNQLSYKLGRAMIENSKSLWGYIRMPYVLSYIRDIHNKEQMAYNERIKKNPSLKLPSLESYPDYKEALKCKEHLSYKLGQALIKAHKNWYKGGYVKFIIDAIKQEKRPG